MTGFINALPGAVVQGLIWGIMAIGVYITYKLLDIADLTVDGSFCTGGAVCAVMITSGYSVWLSMLVALFAGAVAGLVTALLHTKLGIPAILSGILTQLGLWSVNLAVMGMSSNISINDSQYSLAICLKYLQAVKNGDKPWFMHPFAVILLFTAVVIGILYWFFGTELGASIRATGANPNMARAQGINTDTNKIIGLMLSNALVALSGGLLSQWQTFAEIKMGSGAIVTGLAAVVIGEVLFSKLFNNFALKLFAISIGAVIYYTVIQAVISLLDMNPNYMKLITAGIVAVFLAVPYIKGKYFSKHKFALKENEEGGTNA